MTHHIFDYMNRSSHSQIDRLGTTKEICVVDMENVDAWSDWYDQWKG